MSIAIPINFKNDIQSNHTNLIPLVVIRNLIKDENGQIVDTEAIYLSTNSGRIVKNGDVYWKPLLLNVPSIKESIDLETRKHKINSVTLNCSDVEYEGARLSKEIDQKFGSLMNTEVRIFWHSPSSEDVTFFDIAAYDSSLHADRVFQVYTGIVRRYTHTDDKINIELEDKSQNYLNGHLPLPDNYIHTKPLPIVYGTVDKSPLLVDEENKKIIGELASETDLLDLYVYKDNRYIEIPASPSSGAVGSNDPIIASEEDAEIRYKYYNNLVQWSNDVDAVIGLNANQDPENPVVSERLVAISEAIFEEMKIEPLNAKSAFWTNAGWDDRPGRRTWYNALLDTYGDSPGVFGTLVKEYNDYDWQGGSFVDWSNVGSLPAAQPGESDVGIFYELYPDQDLDGDNNKHDRTIVGCTITNNMPRKSSFLDASGVLYSKIRVKTCNRRIYQNSSNMQIRLRKGGDDANDSAVSRFTTMAESGSDSRLEDWEDNVTSDGKLFDDETIVIHNVNQLLIYLILDNDSPYMRMGANLIIDNANIHAFYLMEDIYNEEYYGKVKGRLNVEGGDPKAGAIIKDLFERGVDYQGDPALTFAASDVDTKFDNMQYAFTIHESVESKKLLEEFMSVTGYIGYFDYNNHYKIRSANGFGDISSGLVTVIKPDNIIDLKFSKTKVESVYTRLIFHYNYDYAKEEFLNKTTVVLDDVGTNSNTFGYYGIPTDHSKSTLTIDDHRGKYIRLQSSAEEFASWELQRRRNQHLIAKIELPLSIGLSLELGEILNLKELMKKEKPYGWDESYLVSSTQKIYELNGQYVYTYFMITSISKKIDKITIECEQVVGAYETTHTNYDLAIDTKVEYETTFQVDFNWDESGCMDSAAVNYNPFATIEDGSCSYTPGTGHSLWGGNIPVNWCVATQDWDWASQGYPSLGVALKALIPSIKSFQIWKFDDSLQTPHGWTPDSHRIVFDEDFINEVDGGISIVTSGTIIYNQAWSEFFGAIDENVPTIWSYSGMSDIISNIDEDTSPIVNGFKLYAIELHYYNPGFNSPIVAVENIQEIFKYSGAVQNLQDNLTTMLALANEFPQWYIHEFYYEPDIDPDLPGDEN